jgi:hypothetical protein
MEQTNNSNHITSNPGSEVGPGLYLAKVISNIDATNMGVLEVEILHAGAGNTASSGQTRTVQYMSPFYGCTNEVYTSADPNDYNNTQKSYGMWMIPPDTGVTVIVVIIDKDPKRSYWIGCVLDNAGMNFMVPGIAATEAVVEPKAGRVPVAEYNKKITENTVYATKVKKPRHIFASSLERQGLLKDDIRGITTSSARRESPSMVFGISTPGPIDKRTNAKRGPIGNKEHQVPNAFVSRLGGSTFVMDDGDDKFLRKTPAGGEKQGPPIYAPVEQGDTTGDPTILHNELIRLRTRTGHQILMHNSEDLIYIGNSRGTTWIELTSNGKIDIHAADSISIHTANDLNVTAERDINFNAGHNFNVTAGNNINLTAKADTNIKTTKNNNITTTGVLNVNTTGNNCFTSAATTNIKSGGNHLETAAKIHMNGPGAATAAVAIDAFIPSRVPGPEPWAYHENLDPVNFIPTKTVAVAPDPKLAPKIAPPPPPIPTAFGKYTTITDTFAQVKGAAK